MADGTAPNDPGFGELNRGLGRVEKTLDRIVEKLDGHGETLAEHRVRLDLHDEAIRVLHDTNKAVEQKQTEERRHRSVLRWTAFGSGFVGLLGFAGGLIALLH